MATAKKSARKKAPATKASGTGTPVTEATATKKAAKAAVKQSPNSAKPFIPGETTPQGKTWAKSAEANKSTGRNYSSQASEDVREELHEMHRGKLHIGRSEEKVTNPKQAIAIGLAKARREGAKVPPNPNPNAKPKTKTGR